MVTRQLMLRSLVGLAMVLATSSFASAQHGGHGGGHGGHGGGHSGHGGGHFGGHRGHSRGHGGHFGGHSIRHGNSHFGGHGNFNHGGGHVLGGHQGGHGFGGHGIGHGIGHGGFGHGVHHWYPHFNFYATPFYGGFGFSSYYAPNVYSGLYTTGYRAVEVVDAAPVLVAQVPVPAGAKQQVAARPITTPEGEAFRRKAETAFRSGDFQRAARMANHALVEMPRNGKLLLFAAQTLFAVGDYRNATVVIHQATSQLDAKQWGYVVENYKQFYRGRAYVDQMDQLNEYLKKNPDAGYAHFLRGYQHGFLGHSKSALRDLNKAVELESRDKLAVELIKRFGGTPPVIADQPALELKPAVDPAPAQESRAEKLSEPTETNKQESKHHGTSPAQ